MRNSDRNLFVADCLVNGFGVCVDCGSAVDGRTITFFLGSIGVSYSRNVGSRMNSTQTEPKQWCKGAVRGVGCFSIFFVMTSATGTPEWPR